MTTTNNSRAERKTLASQLDRLDGILDALSDGLNQAVASTVEQAVEQAVRQAVGQAVHEAVQAVLTEVLTNPDLRAALHQQAPEVQEPAPQQRPAPPSLLGRLCDAAGAGVRRLAKACGAGLQRLGRLRQLACAGWSLTRRCRRQLLIACSVGVAACLALYGSGPWLAAAAGWLGGVAGTLAVQTRQSLRRLLPATTVLT